MKSVSPAYRVVIDTNLLISGTILKRGNPFALLELWRSGIVLLITSPQQIAEFEDVIDRPKVRIDYDISEIEAQELRHRLRSLAVTVHPALPSAIALRDPDDDFVLASAIQGDADFLISGDKDLLAVSDDSRLGRLRILTVSSFLREYASP